MFKAKRRSFASLRTTWKGVIASERSERGNLLLKKRGFLAPLGTTPHPKRT